MNWRAAAETLSDDPPFWIELSTWDGNRGKPDDKRGLYTQMGQTYGPERYEGMVQFGLWLVQPRIVREFRGHSERRSDYEPYFRAVLRGVERIHRDPDLRRFWEQGKLVVASHREHPYQTDLPGGWGARGRWFLLRTSVDPSEPWKLDTPLTVFALAHGMGEKPHRRWLIYAHAPAGLARQVTINIPDFSGLQVDVPPRGAFWVVEESPANVRALDPDPGPR
jgi:hypothetical protein